MGPLRGLGSPRASWQLTEGAFGNSLKGVALNLELTLKLSLAPGPWGAVKNRLCPKQIENYY